MPRRLALGMLFLAGLALWGVLEGGQLLLPSRTPDVTDVIVPATAAWFAAWVVSISPRARRHG